MIVREERHDPWGSYTAVWHVAPPLDGKSFVVTHETWCGHGFSERHIYAWRYA